MSNLNVDAYQDHVFSVEQFNRELFNALHELLYIQEKLAPISHLDFGAFSPEMKEFNEYFSSSTDNMRMSIIKREQRISSFVFEDADPKLLIKMITRSSHERGETTHTHEFTLPISWKNQIKLKYQKCFSGFEVVQAMPDRKELASDMLEAQSVLSEVQTNLRKVLTKYLTRCIELHPWVRERLEGINVDSPEEVLEYINEPEGILVLKVCPNKSEMVRVIPFFDVDYVTEKCPLFEIRMSYLNDTLKGYVQFNEDVQGIERRMKDLEEFNRSQELQTLLQTTGEL